MSFVIVKHAASEMWEFYFESNPQKGVHPSYSAHDTYIGQQLNICSSYVTRELAYKDLERMLARNPSGGYAVCPVLV